MCSWFTWMCSRISFSPESWFEVEMLPLFFFAIGEYFGLFWGVWGDWNCLVLPLLDGGAGSVGAAVPGNYPLSVWRLMGVIPANRTPLPQRPLWPHAVEAPVAALHPNGVQPVWGRDTAWHPAAPASRPHRALLCHWEPRPGEGLSCLPTTWGQRWASGHSPLRARGVMKAWQTRTGRQAWPGAWGSPLSRPREPGPPWDCLFAQAWCQRGKETALDRPLTAVSLGK